MIAVLISILFAATAANTAIQYELSLTWTIVSAFGGYILGSLAVGLGVRRKLKVIQEDLQTMMQAAQGRISRTVQQAQNKPGTNPAALQKQIEIQQNEVLKKGLDHTELLEPFRTWSPTLGRQIATMRLQFLYQLKRFDEVDELLATKNFFRKPLLMEPTLIGMKLARIYKNEDLETLEKAFRKHVRWVKGDRASLLYGLMSWAYVKKGQPEQALSLLAKAKDSTANDTLTRNWEHLANDRVKKFSNAGLGEEWYALYLESQPKPKMQRQKGRQARF